MKSLLFVLIISVGLYPTYEPGTTVTTDNGSTTGALLPDSISFPLHIQPILVSHCMPCHFEGGKMYERMPFDTASTILNPEFKNGLLKRIKDEKENALLKMFLENSSE